MEEKNILKISLKTAIIIAIIVLLILLSFGIYYYFITKKDGNVQIQSISNENPTQIRFYPEEELSENDLLDYFLGENHNGRNILEIIDSDTFSFIKDPNNENSKIYKGIKLAYVSDKPNVLYIRFNRAVYRIDIDENGVTEYVKKISNATGNLGKYVDYNNTKWIVLYEDASKIELITANTMNLINFTGETFEDRLKEYNNSVEKLEEECKNAIQLTEDNKIILSIRCVGQNRSNIVKYIDIGGSLIESDGYLRKEDVEQLEGYDSSNGGWFLDFWLRYKFKEGDEDYIADLEKMKKIGIVRSDNGEYYWLASREVHAYSSLDRSSIRFCVRLVNDVGNVSEECICSIDNNNESYGVSGDYGLRPIITLNKDSITFTQDSI